jgi:hypothetical protein
MGSERAGVLVWAGDLMVDVEDHGGATPGGALGDGHKQPMRLMREGSLAQHRVSVQPSHTRGRSLVMIAADAGGEQPSPRGNTVRSRPQAPARAMLKCLRPCGETR